MDLTIQRVDTETHKALSELAVSRALDIQVESKDSQIS